MRFAWLSFARALVSKMPTAKSQAARQAWAVVSFNDGHSEARKSETINPPANPADGGPKGLINS
jgi:hypothetical protein